MQQHEPYRLPLHDIGCTADVDTPEMLVQVAAFAARLDTGV